MQKYGRNVAVSDVQSIDDTSSVIILCQLQVCQALAGRSLYKNTASGFATL